MSHSASEGKTLITRSHACRTNILYETSCRDPFHYIQPVYMYFILWPILEKENFKTVRMTGLPLSYLTNSNFYLLYFI